MMKILIKILFLSVCIPIWIYFITPYLLRIPKNFSYSADVTSVDNFYDPVSKSYKGESYSKTAFYYEVTGQMGLDLDIKNVFDVKTLDGKQVFKADPTYKVHSIGGKVEEGATADSYLFAPRNLKKGQRFTYRHVTSPKPIEMKFLSEESLYGLKVFKYEKVNPEPDDQTHVLTFYPDVGVTKGIKLISNMYLWIEPVTGHIVNMEDFSTDYYYYDLKTGEKLYPHNKFINMYTKESIEKHVKIAKLDKTKTNIITYFLPIFFILILLTHSMSKIERVRGVFKDWKILILPLLLFSMFFTGSKFLRQYIEDARTAQFAHKAEEVNFLISDHLYLYINVLLSGRGFMDASDTDMNRASWATYVDSLNLTKNYPGIQGLGFTKTFNKDELASVEQAARNSGLPNFKVFPPDARDFYTSIIYLEPVNARNAKALGFDMYTEETRRSAMKLAFETKSPAMSGKVKLLQEIDSDVQAGFLVYVPVYRDDKLFGYVYAAFRMKDFINTVFANSDSPMDFQIYDGLRPIEENLMYDRSQQTGAPNKKKNVLFKETKIINIANHPWTIEITNSAIYQETLTNRVLPYGVLFMGSFVSLLIGTILYTIKSSERKAFSYAHMLNEDLENNKQNLEEQNKQLAETIEESRTLTKVMVDRELRMAEMKKELEKLKGTS